jgi:hypothetical protein
MAFVSVASVPPVISAEVRIGRSLSAERVKAANQTPGYGQQARPSEIRRGHLKDCQLRA